MHRLRRTFPAVVALALVAGACSGPSTGGTESTESTTTIATGDGDVAFVVSDEGAGSEPDAGLSSLEEEQPISDIAEVVATGLIEGEYRVPTRCMLRDEPGGPHLHAAFNTSTGVEAGESFIHVVFRIRPPDRTGTVELAGGDLKIRFNPNGTWPSEPMEGRFTAEVQHGTNDLDIPLAEIAFEGTYRGDAGEGTLQGTITCTYVP